jgi:hypothetical protein
MVSGRETFRVFAVMFGAVLLLTGLLVSPALGQQNTGGIQYDNDEAICQAVINIVLNTVQNNENNGNDQYVNDISQELNISPSIVQECVEGGLGDDNPDDGDNGDGDNGDGDDDGDDPRADDVINVPDKNLPNTGGFPPLLVAGFLLVVGGGLITAVVRRRY